MRSSSLLGLVLLAACGDSASTPTPAGDGGPVADASVFDAVVPGDGGPPSSCEPFGHFGVPQITFTLPAPVNGRYSYPDLQKSFPAVDWTTLDRLYIPAGKYKSVELGNLPTRDPKRPLVITNLGGQVQVGPNDPGGNFIWAVNGGSNWVLTGRYDPDSKTGDAAFPGHRCGAYATSRGKYGFLSDDAFAKGQYLHMGLAVGSATSFELEFLEITRSGFAGIRLLNARAASDPPMPMADVRVHDTYVHDVDSEGVYFGWTGAPPSNLFPGLQFYNNRLVRTGSEALQVQDLGDGSHVHHNVFAFAALHWLDNFGHYQDGGSQVLVREGNVELDHNVTMGGAAVLLSFFSAAEAGDGNENVVFHDNYFADTRNLGAYLNGSSTAPSSFTFRGNFLRGLDFAYTPVDPAATDPGVIFGINGANQAPILFDGNQWEGSRSLTYGLALNGTKGNVTATANVTGPVTPVAFVDSGYPAEPTSRLSAWGPTATLAPGTPPIQYAVGDLVTYDAVLYRAKTANTGLVPPQHPEAWETLPLPTDDLRVVPSSPYAAMGVQ